MVRLWILERHVCRFNLTVCWKVMRFFKAHASSRKNMSHKTTCSGRPLAAAQSSGHRHNNPVTPPTSSLNQTDTSFSIALVISPASLRVAALQYIFFLIPPRGYFA